MINKLSIRDVDVRGKKVLIRVDFNVPLNKGSITDDTRIKMSLPTIQYVLKQGGIPILMSHLGRPDGERRPEFSLAPCAQRLAELLQQPVQMAPDCYGVEVEKMANALKPGEILLLENLRFHKGEEHPSEEPNFASALARLGDLYVDDAFASAHREHASVETITQFFPGKAVAGLLMEKEIEYLGSILLSPKRPFYTILGGAKVSTKFKVIQALLDRADVLLIGGAMAYTFFQAEEISIGNSFYEEDFLTVARQILDVSSQSNCRLILPIDVVVADRIDPQASTHIVNMKEGIPPGFEGVDIGPATIALYKQELQQAATVFWNGPLGVFECPPFDRGTAEVAQALTHLSATTIIGGGDTIAAITAAGVVDQISHLSTGGGATLEYIEFGQLPGIEALSDKENSNNRVK